MSWRVKLIIIISVCAPLIWQGCVVRKFHIHSRPEGAPVWVDEQYQGETPVELQFTHYGSRRVRVGPIRDERGGTVYAAREKIYKLRTPWYQRFPIDFFVEVLWPATIEDSHTLLVYLEAERTPDVEHDVDAQVRDALNEAAEYRQKAGQPPAR